MEQQPMVRKVMRPPKGDNITLAQAKRAFRKVMRREAEERKRAEQQSEAGEREPPGTEA
jgi:hypothetical protein